MATVEEIEARRAARKAELETQRQAQLAKDLEALDELEVEHGDGQIVRVDLNFYTPDLPTMVLARVPRPAEFKRYQDQCSKKNEGAIVAATNLLGESCVVYPDKETYARVREKHAGVHVVLATRAVNACAGRQAEEGKD
jgi:hypothetical protein